MGVDIKLLARHGVSSAAYKKVWAVDYAELKGKPKELLDLISARCKDGKTQNLTEWRAWHAIDLAYDAPFNQTTPTLINHILSQKLDLAQTREALENYGLSEDALFIKTPDGKGALNAPLFFQIVIPLVKAYTSVRLAKLFNERNSNPLLPYDPLRRTEKDQVLCEIVTGAVNNIAVNYGYPAVMRQAIQQMLKYGVMLTFPREEWHCERQLEGAAGAEKRVTVKEGLRYLMPHPTRMFYDLNHPLTSINTDSGVEFLGMWHVLKYGDILDNRQYWNREKIFCGTNWFDFAGVGNFFQEVYPCSAKFPSGMMGGGKLTREDKAAWYSQSGGRDQSVFMTEYFQKLVPKQWGLADYKYPVWHRFTLAGDDTVVWSAPCGYNPSWFMGYDYDENAGRNASMALECIPWQDHVGNILSQIILTAKQNLENTIFYDTNIVDKTDIDRMANMGERRYRSTNYIGFDSTKRRIAGLDQRQAFLPVNLTKANLQELFQLLPMVLNVMERVLQISAQEVGSQGSHQQSKFELQQVGGAGTNRLALTASYVDEGIDAWKTQLKDASLAYLDAEIVGEVSADIEGAEELLKDLGFEIEQRGKDKLVIRGKKHAIKLARFARSNEGVPQQTEKEVSQTIFQVVGTLAGQPDLHKKVGSKNLLAMIEFAAHLAGAPRDWRLKEMPKDQQGQDEEVPQNILEAIQQAQKATLQAVEEKIAKPAAQEVGQVQSEVQQLQQAIEQLKGIYQVAAQTQDKNAIKAKDSQAAQQRKDQAEALTQRRKDEAARREQERKDELARADIQRQAEKAQAEIAIAEHKAKAETELAAKREPEPDPA